MSILDSLDYKYDGGIQETLSLNEYLDRASQDKSYYLSPAERILKSIGEPTIIDTSQDKLLSKIFLNRVIKKYDTFKDFYGMEDTIEQIVSYFKHSAQGLEEQKQILYLLGPVGGGKSSLAEKLKELMCKEPIYAIKGSPIFESPLGLFSIKDSDKLNIPPYYLQDSMSPWLVKRLDELKGDISKLEVVKFYPNIYKRIAIAKTEPGDDNNQDISSLVGKLDIRQLEHFTPNDPDAYSFSGGLCRGNRGLLEFVEMFKAPIKILHPLLTATQEHNYNGTQDIGGIPFDGIVLAHSNEAEWDKFRNNKNNEAFIDRISLVEVPYALRASEEEKILQKYIKNSSLSSAPCAPGTLKILAEFNVLTRLEPWDQKNLYTKLEVYDGRDVKSKNLTYNSVAEYKDNLTKIEGFSGFSTRNAFKVLSKTYNYNSGELAADPVSLLSVLHDFIEKQHYPEDTTVLYKSFIQQFLKPNYLEELGKDIQESYLDSAWEYGQNLFERYVKYADKWVQDEDYRDPVTGSIFNRNDLNNELEKIEKPAGIANPKDFRNEIVNFVLRERAKNGGKSPSWDSYGELKRVIEKNIFSSTADLLPIISFSGYTNEEDNKKHDKFIKNMNKKGYTTAQIKTVVSFHERNRKQ